MDTRDLELKLLSKEPIVVDNVPIYPISIDEISSIGFVRYNGELRFLCMNSGDVQTLIGKDISQVGVFKYLVGNALEDKELMGLMLFWFSVLTHEKVVFDKKKFAFQVGDCMLAENAYINQENFNEIQRVIRGRNGLTDVEEEIDNPANDVTRRILEQRKEARLKLKKAKEKGNEDEDCELTLADLVSILAAGLHLPIETVMGYDLYQFNNQFNRLRIFNDYDVSVQALLHGAKKDDVHFTHWISKIQTPE